METGSESIEAIMRRRQILFAEFVPRMEDTRLLKCVAFGKLVGGTGCMRGRKKSGWDALWMISELSVSTPTSGRRRPRIRGNGARRRDKGRNVSW